MDGGVLVISCQATNQGESHLSFVERWTLLLVRFELPSTLDPWLLFGRVMLIFRLLHSQRGGTDLHTLESTRQIGTIRLGRVQASCRSEHRHPQSAHSIPPSHQGTRFNLSCSPP